MDENTLENNDDSLGKNFTVPNDNDFAGPDVVVDLSEGPSKRPRTETDTSADTSAKTSAARTVAPELSSTPSKMQTRRGGVWVKPVPAHPTAVDSGAKQTTSSSRGKAKVVKSKEVSSELVRRRSVLEVEVVDRFPFGYFVTVEIDGRQYMGTLSSVAGSLIRHHSA